MGCSRGRAVPFLRVHRVVLVPSLLIPGRVSRMHVDLHAEPAAGQRPPPSPEPGAIGGGAGG
eukprot:3400122-Pyramimonas_sp.AAC.1